MKIDMKKILYLAVVSLCLVSGGDATVAQNKDKSLSEVLNQLVDMKFVQQVQNEMSFQKKKKSKDKLTGKIDGISTDYDKFLYLNGEAVSELDKFVLSSVAKSGSAPDRKDVATIYMSPVTSSLEAVFYIFLDGKCIGAGSCTKGINCYYPIGDSEESVQNLTIVESIPAYKQKNTVFSSSVHFGIKNNYVFSAAVRGKVVTELNVKN